LFILSSAAFSQPFIASVSFKTPNVSVSFGKRYIDTYSYTKYERDMQISKINAAYNQQVREAMNLRISASKKIDLIQELQRERNNKLQNVNDRFCDYRNKYNDNHYNRDYTWNR
jgi:hypothetical protein